MNTKLLTICLLLVTSQVFAKECKGGYGKHWDNCYGTYAFSNGAKYVGEFKDSKENGQGTYTEADGSKVTGEFKDGNFVK